MEKKTLFIPSNIETEKQILDGIGILELMFMIGFVFSTITIFLILKLAIDISGAVIGFAILVSMGVSYMLAKKDNNNMSFLLLLKNFYKFMLSTKIYKYKYRSEWLINGDR